MDEEQNKQASKPIGFGASQVIVKMQELKDTIEKRDSTIEVLKQEVANLQFESDNKSEIIKSLQKTLAQKQAEINAQGNVIEQKKVHISPADDTIREQLERWLEQRERAHNAKKSPARAAAEMKGREGKKARRDKAPAAPQEPTTSQESEYVQRKI